MTELSHDQLRTPPRSLVVFGRPRVEVTGLGEFDLEVLLADDNPGPVGVVLGQDVADEHAIKATPSVGDGRRR